MKKMWNNRLEMQASKYKKQDLHTIFKTIALVLFSVIMITSCQDKSSSTGSVKAEVKYTCPMHPQIVESTFGSCPICGMDLVERHQQPLKMEVDSSLTTVIQATNASVLSDINTIRVGEKTVSDTLVLNGMVTYDSNNLKTISARIGGRIEKLFVKYNFQKIAKGQKIMEIYSPELAAAQQDLLYVKAKGDVNLLQQTKTKLRLLGVSASQIEQILKTQKVNYRIPIYSTASGYLIDGNTAKMNSEADPSKPAILNTENSSISIVEGQYVKTGDALFKVFNSNNVWADFYANASESSALKKDQAIKINGNSGNISAKVGLVQPYFYGGQSYSVIRVYLDNGKKNFKIGELLQGKIIITPQTGLWVSADAVYQLGNKNIVFIKKNNVLKARAVTVSTITNARALIVEGLSEGDQIASNASYLIDTESFIKTEN